MFIFTNCVLNIVTQDDKRCNKQINYKYINNIFCMAGLTMGRTIELLQAHLGLG